LIIEPVVPEDWDEFNAVRYYQEVRYEISASRKGPGNQVKLLVDEQPVQGTLVRLPSPGTSVVRVEVQLGEYAN